MAWTDEMVAVLRDCYRKSMSARETADEMNRMFYGERSVGSFSRNGIIGKWHRLNLKRRRPKAVQAKDGNPPKPARKKRKSLPYREPEVTAYDTAAPCIGWEDLEKNTCRWPYGDPRQEGGLRYCGATVHKRSYCSTHFARAYVCQKG
jgi:GcrA cell cycle regulator